MKRLSDYIYESIDVLRLNEVTIKYTVNPEEYIVQVPNSYSEDDTTIYMGDKLFTNCPSSEDHANDFFGKNADNIFDVYFEYDGFEHNDSLNDKSPNLEWDAHYDKNVSEDAELINYKFDNLMLVIKFDRFDMTNTDEYHIKETLEKIFMATVSNDYNEYNLDLSLKPENIEYKK